MKQALINFGFLRYFVIKKYCFSLLIIFRSKLKFPDSFLHIITGPFFILNEESGSSKLNILISTPMTTCRQSFASMLHQSFASFFINDYSLLALLPAWKDSYLILLSDDHDWPRFEGWLISLNEWLNSDIVS